MGADASGRGVIRRAVAGQRRDVVVGSLLGAAHQTGEALVPVLIGLIVDRAVVRPDGGALALWLVVLAVVYAMLSYSFRSGARAGERAAEQAAHRLRLDVVRRVLAPHGGAEAGRPPGALVNVATEDARRVGALNMALTLGIAAVVGVVAGAVLLLRASVPLGLLVLVGAPVLMALGHFLARPLEHRSEAEQERAAHASGVAADPVAGVRVLKGLRAERAAVVRYRATSQASLEASVRAARAAALQTGLMLTLTGAFIALVALVGGRLVLSGSIGLGPSSPPSASPSSCPDRSPYWRGSAPNSPRPARPPSGSRTCWPLRAIRRAARRNQPFPALLRVAHPARAPIPPDRPPALTPPLPGPTIPPTPPLPPPVNSACTDSGTAGSTGST